MSKVKNKPIKKLFIVYLLGLFLSLMSFSISADQIETTQRFRLHLVEDPGRILPQFQTRSSSQYLVGNIFDSYYKLNKKAELEASMMKSCVWKSNTRLICIPNKRRWANGKEIKAEDYFEHLKRQLDKNSFSAAKELFSDLLNYKDYLASKVPFEKVGLKLKKNKIEFSLSSVNRDFMYNLTHPVLSPIPDTDQKDQKIAQDFATGPYKLKEWRRGRSLLLERNEQHPIKIQNAPLVEFFYYS